MGDIESSLVRNIIEAKQAFFEKRKLRRQLKLILA
jgi:hypothetical protein